jgi:hypothetical protein
MLASGENKKCGRRDHHKDDEKATKNTILVSLSKEKSIKKPSVQ